MSEKPILFNTEMVRAILDGRKSCTRRVVKKVIPFNENANCWNILKNGEWSGPVPKCKLIEQCAPYQIGDILYVRETWFKGVHRYLYRADYSDTEKFYRNGKEIEMKWRPSIHMPKAAARIWLKVTDVRAERLQEITEDGAKSEGAIDSRGFILSPDNEYNRMHTAREHFAEIWNGTLKKSDLDRYGWDANPWVWVIEFERCEKPGKEI